MVLNYNLVISKFSFNRFRINVRRLKIVLKRVRNIHKRDH